MGKECGAWVSRRLWGGGNTSLLKTTAWEAIKGQERLDFPCYLRHHILSEIRKYLARKFDTVLIVLFLLVP